MQTGQPRWWMHQAGPLVVGAALVVFGFVALGDRAPVEAQAPTAPEWKDASRDPLPSDAALAAAIRRGEQIYNDPQQHAAAYVGASLACWSCHVGEGYHPGLIPLSGVASSYPEYSPRDGRVISLEDRIRSCFARSLNGTPPPYDSEVLLAISAFLNWQSAGQPHGSAAPTRYSDAIPAAELIAIDRLEPRRGQELYAQRCASCHGADGQGGDAIPPVWGRRSYNDGAGLARVYTLADLIYQAMPVTAPGTLSRADAQHLAAYINAQERPVYANWAQDYPGVEVPVDAVYNQRRYPTNPLRAQLDAR